MDILFYLLFFTLLNTDTMSKEDQLPEPEETQLQAAESDSVPPADKPRPPKNPDTEE